MKHRHADLMLLFANDAQETDKPWKRWEYYCVGGKWLPLRGTPTWDELINYRRIKPKDENRYCPRCGVELKWHAFSHCKAKTVKKWRWVMRGLVSDWWITDEHYGTPHEAETHFDYGTAIQRIDSTMIEIEE